MSTPETFENSRDRGLNRGVGALGLGVAVFNTVVGAGIFVLPAALAHDIGAAAPFAYLACLVAMSGVVLCFAAAGSRTPTSGGPYGYADAAFGPLIGFIVGVLIWLGSVLAAAGIAAAIADSFGRFIPFLAAPPLRALIIVALFAAFAAINVAGVTRGAGLVGVLTIVKLVPIAALLGFGAVHVHLANLRPSVPEPRAFGRALILAAFAFQGMESALAVSGEVRRPARNIPLGLIGAMGAIALLYIAIQTVTQGVLGPALALSKTPLADALAGVSPLLVGLLIAGGALSMLGYLAGDTLSAPRLLFAFAGDGLLPKRLAALHPRTAAPYAAILTHVIIGAALALSGSFVELAILSSLTTVVVYIVSCAAAVVLQRRGVAQAGPPLAIPGLIVAAVVGALGMGWIALSATWQEAGGLFLVIGLSAAWYGIVAGLRGRRGD